jgi:hypothetical protein
MRFTKRLRGGLLRLALNRTVAASLGLSLLIPAVWLLVQDFPWETSITDGLGLIIGATGAAFLFAGVGGRRPDWH